MTASMDQQHAYEPLWRSLTEGFNNLAGKILTGSRLELAYPDHKNYPLTVTSDSHLKRLGNPKHQDRLLNSFLKDGI